MRTWRKIEETKKRTTDILTLKQKNFDRVSIVFSTSYYIMNLAIKRVKE